MTPEEQKAADDKAAADAKAKSASSSAVEDTLIAEGDAKLGGPFTIRGSGFGSGGTVTIGGVQVKTTSWNDHVVKGTAPAGLKGEVVMDVGGKKLRGPWPYVRPTVTRTTTVTVETK